MHDSQFTIRNRLSNEASVNDSGAKIMGEDEGCCGKIKSVRLGCRRIVAAHAPRLATKVFFECFPPAMLALLRYARRGL